MECSAKDDTNITEMFNTIGEYQVVRCPVSLNQIMIIIDLKQHYV